MAAIYENRGLKKTTLTVAKELTEHDVLGAHIRDELGIKVISQANPLQAALFLGAAFTVGGALLFLVTVFFTLNTVEFYIHGITIILPISLSAISSKTGGVKYNKGCHTYYFLGYYSHVTYCSNRLFIQY